MSGNINYSALISLVKGAKGGVAGVIGVALAYGLVRLGMDTEQAHANATAIAAVGAAVGPFVYHAALNWWKNR